MSDTTFSSLRSTLSPQLALELATLHLNNARKANDPDVAFALCDEAEAALSRIRDGPEQKALSSSTGNVDQAVCDGIASRYLEHGNLLEGLGYIEMAKSSYSNAEKWGRDQKTDQPPSDSSQASSDKETGSVSSPHHLPTLLDPGDPQVDLQHIPPNIFSQNVAPTVAKYSLPNTGARLESAPQLAYCLSLLPSPSRPLRLLEEAEQAWSQVKANHEYEQERLRTLAADLTKAFINDELKSPSSVAEVVCLAPVLDQENFRKLFSIFISGINQATLLELYLVEGLAQLMQCASPDYLHADDLVRILEVLNTRLKNTHLLSTQHVYRLTLAVSHVLDAMADYYVEGLKREPYESLSNYLEGLTRSSDPYLVYQAAYAFQALKYIPDYEPPWQVSLRRTGRVVKGVAGIMSAVKTFDVNGFLDGLTQLQDGLVEVYQIADIAHDGVRTLVENGQDLFDTLKESLSFEKKRAWYSTLRGIDSLVRNGRLAEVKKLIYEAPCRPDIAFQWGVCQRLGEIAADPLWDLHIRRNAVDFLGEVYRNDAEWGQQVIVKQWVLNILKQLASQSESILQYAKTLLLELSADGDIAKQGLYKACLEKPQSQYPLAVAVPPQEFPSLLDRVQQDSYIEVILQQLRKRSLNERRDAIYISPQARPNLHVHDDALFSLMDKVNDFLRSDQKVMLLLGDSGAGKSMFSRKLERDLWYSYKKMDNRIPLFIDLPEIEKPDEDLISKHLLKAGFSKRHFRELKGYYRFVLICDGYDESQKTQNLYTSNRLNQPGEWTAQMVISCCSESLGLDYRDRFQPSDPELFQEAVIAPFSQNQVHEYIKKYVSSMRTIWEMEAYLNAFETIPSLKDLVKNPFMLTLTMEALPLIVDPGQDLTSVRVTRVALYDQFVEQWLERGKRRLADKELSSQARADFERLSEDDYTQNGIAFLKDLACAIYKHQAGYPAVTYSHRQYNTTWKKGFFSREDEKQLLLEAAPLTCSGSQYRFIHKSILEYCLARAVFEPQDTENTKRQTPVPAPERRGSIHSVESFESQDTCEESTVFVPIGQAMLDSPLAWKTLVGESSVIQFLAERVQQEPVFKNQLLAVIELSKVNKGARKAAANAITILIRAGVGFDGEDLKGIRIPGADLSGGQFNSAQLQGADLRHVNLRNIWLRQANLSNARMSGVQFGEWPYLQEDSEIFSCSYSPDGNTCAMGLSDGTISVYETTTWVKTDTLHGHTGRVTSVTYSPCDHQIVSGSNDGTGRLWDLETGLPGPILSGHTHIINSVTFSPSGHQIASGSNDFTVRLWDAKTGTRGLILRGHTNVVTSVMYSPSGNCIASGSWDKTVRLWNVQTGSPGPILSDHTARINSVAYSPMGHQIASGAWDSTVRLWDAHTGAPGPTLDGHTDIVTSVTYSPDGHQIATGSDDMTVRLWDAQTGAAGPILSGHFGYINGVTYSQNGSQIASGGSDSTVRLWNVHKRAASFILKARNRDINSATHSPVSCNIASRGDDKIVRLWDAQTGAASLISSGHTDRITSVAYSPSGRRIASGSWDSTVRLWDAQTGAPYPILIGHTDVVRSVVYSPNGHQIASGSYDKTVRLWDAQTGAPGLILRGHTDRIISVTYSPNSRQIAARSLDGTVRLWDAQTDDRGAILKGYTPWITSLTYSPCSGHIVCVSVDDTVRLWDAHTRVRGSILYGHTDVVTSAIYSPNGQQITSGSWDKTVRLWDAHTGAPGHILNGHTGIVATVTYSPTGHQIASGSNDGTVRLWDVKTGATCFVLNGHTGCITTLTYSPTGHQIASGSNNGTVWLWDVNSGKLLVTVVDDLRQILSVTWDTTLNIVYVATICGNSVRTRKVVEEGGSYQVYLHWRSAHSGLSLSNTSIQDAQGLSRVNMQLLNQRGAVGDPAMT